MPLHKFIKEKEVQESFEANFLDGDKIQDGQTLSSQECFNAVIFFLEDLDASWRKRIEKKKLCKSGNLCSACDVLSDLLKED